MRDSPLADPGCRTGPAWLPARFLEERFWIGALAAAVAFLVLLYLRFALLVKIDHDEVEHAHAAFRIVSGELPYRDFYQNHWPAYWAVTTQFVQAFPFSINAILAGRAVSLLALAGCWWLGLRWLAQVPGGITKLSVLVYTAAVIILALVFQFFLARPDPLMTLLATAGMCLAPATGRLRSARAFGLGLLFGLAVSVSSKVLPMVLVIPLWLMWQATSGRSMKPVLAGVSFAVGFGLALLPTAAWIWRHDLWEGFWFDVFALNLAVSKPWHQSFGLLNVSLFMPAVLGLLAWAWVRSKMTEPNESALGLVLLALCCGLLLAAGARHASIYNLQVLTIPLAVGFASLVSFLWQQGGKLGNRLLIVATLLAFPASNTAGQLAMLVRGSGISQGELQALMDLARPGGRSCIAFSPAHPVFCRSVSQLSNGWDLTFVQSVSEPRQRERFQRIWQEGIARTLEVKPHIVLRNEGRGIWGEAVKRGLVRQDQLVALDALRSEYEVRVIGIHEFWVRRSAE